MRAADALCEALKAEGVEHVFGIPGGANLPTYDALYDAELIHIQSRHEQGAGHAAEGYAKASGRVGVAFATSGPGATNLVTAIADAMMDSVPTVFITGQVRTDLIGTDGFQEADVTGITMPIVKHSFLVTDPRQIPAYIHQAFHIASTGRPGPVLVDVPQDLSRADIEYEPAAGAARPARLQAADRGQHQADPARRQGARQRPAAGDLRRRRDRQRQRLRGVPRLLPLGPASGDAHRDGPGRLPGAARAVARDARHARHPDRQLRDGQRRPDRRRGRPLRRPDHRQARRVRAAGQVRPHRHRPGGDLQERPGPHPDRRRRRRRAAEADRRVRAPERRPRAARRVVEADPRLAGGVPARLRGLRGLGDQAAADDRGPLQGHRGRRDHHLRRRPAPDVVRAVLQLLEAAPVDQLGRPRHDGLRPAGGDRRQGGEARTRRWSAWPGTAAW